MPREFETGLSGADSRGRSLWSGLSGAVFGEAGVGREERGGTGCTPQITGRINARRGEGKSRRANGLR
jgi:hypothetical protein